MRHCKIVPLKYSEEPSTKELFCKSTLEYDERFNTRLKYKWLSSGERHINFITLRIFYQLKNIGQIRFFLYTHTKVDSFETHPTEVMLFFLGSGLMDYTSNFLRAARTVQCFLHFFFVLFLVLTVLFLFLHYYFQQSLELSKRQFAPPNS